MKTSLRWLNSLLPKANLSAQTAESGLMAVGFPIDSATPTPPGVLPQDILLDVEVTSNRGDCLCHLGLARELAAKFLTPLLLPDFSPPSVSGAPIDQSLSLSLTLPEPAACPLFTAKLIRNVKIGPSPAWLRERLESVGQRSINNVVDVTNFIAFELGNPCHVFDAAKLAGGKLVVRMALPGETLTTLDGKKRTLAGDELVVADQTRPQSLAGVIGGFDSQVTDGTTDVVLEMATWDPVTVRRASRRHQVRTDASHRFERIVDARTIEAASNRAAALICQVAGGQVAPGVLSQGTSIAPDTRIRFRPSRVSQIMGIDVPREESISILQRLEIQVEPLGRGGEELVAIPPAYRPDLTREIDLIEEVARLKGLDAIGVQPRMAMVVKSPQTSESARREVTSLLTGFGFYETVTFSFCTREHGALFLPTSLKAVEIDDERRRHEPVLRPSVAVGLLTCRKANQFAKASQPGGVRLFEISAVFGERDHKSFENLNLGLLLDVPMSGRYVTLIELQMAIRQMRGTIEALVHAMAGRSAQLVVKPMDVPSAGVRQGSCAGLELAGEPLGYFGCISDAAMASFELERPVIIAEVNMSRLLAGFPARAVLQELPAYPAIERDISFVVPEQVTCEAIEAGIRACKVEWLEGSTFVGTYRGKQIGAGRKSVTMRLHFRDPGRTLKHEEVDGPAASVVSHLQTAVGARVREA